MWRLRNLGACWLAIALMVTGCNSARELDLGGNRYLVTATGNGYANVGSVEQTFAQWAREVAQLHGFDSYRVIEFNSGFERTPLGSRPTAKGVVLLYNAPKTTADGKPVRPAGSKSW